MSQISRSQRRALERAARTRREPAPWIRPRIAIAGVVMAGLAVWFVWRWIENPDPIREGAPAWAPDGRRIVFYSEQPDGKADLFIREIDGTGVIQLTRTPADEGGPSWSPDGAEIAFDSDRDGNFEIYAMPAAADAAARRLTSHPGRDLAPAWSPDGRTIAFMSNRESPEFDIFLMDADGSNVRRLTSAGSAWFPQVSPDGTRIAFHLGRDVHIVDVATAQLRRLTTDPQNGMYPTWNPDGTRLAFMTWRTGPTEIFTMDVDGGEQTRLVGMSTGSAIDPRWSPDGRHIAFVSVPEESVHASQDANQQRVIYIVELATGRMRRLHR